MSAALDRNRFGAGATYHVNPTFSCHARPLCDGVVELDDALGLLMQVAHTIPFQGTGGFDFGARLTWGLSYTVKNAQQERDAIDGSSFGLFAGIRL